MSEHEDFSLEVLTDFFDAVEVGISVAGKRPRFCSEGST
jgi:hypothetical protein